MRIRAGATLLLLTLPWLYPFASGPSPAVMPWLVTLACATLLWYGRSTLTPRLVLGGWLAAALVSSLIGLLQYAGGLEGAGGGLGGWLATAPAGEAYGNLRQRNQFATLTNIGLAALLWLGVISPARHAVVRHSRVAGVVLLAAANAASASRTGLVQLGLMAAVATLWQLGRDRELRSMLLGALLSYGIATAILPLFLHSTFEQHGIWARLDRDDLACNGRLVLWRNVLHLIKLRPWTGWGWGELDYAHFMTLYSGPRFCQILDNAHNLPLHLAVELGVPVALLVCATALAGLLFMRPWAERDPVRQAAWMVLALLAVHSLLEYPLWYGPFQLALALSLWLLRRRRLSQAAVPAAPRRAGPDRVIAAALLAACVYAAWDYYRVSQIYYPPEARAPAYREHTLEKIRGTYLFRDQLRFAEFSLTPPNRENAGDLLALGREVIHYSPEPAVVERLIESAELAGDDATAGDYERRFRAAYPLEYERWMAPRRRARNQPGPLHP